MGDVIDIKPCRIQNVHQSPCNRPRSGLRQSKYERVQKQKRDRRKNKLIYQVKGGNINAKKLAGRRENYFPAGLHKLRAVKFMLKKEGVADTPFIVKFLHPRKIKPLRLCFHHVISLVMVPFVCDENDLRRKNEYAAKEGEKYCQQMLL